ncbi:hypothetical protein RUND412_009529, partial [Rhizina undulata]
FALPELKRPRTHSLHPLLRAPTAAMSRAPPSRDQEVEVIQCRDRSPFRGGWIAHSVGAIRIPPPVRAVMKTASRKSKGHGSHGGYRESENSGIGGFV